MSFLFSASWVYLQSVSYYFPHKKGDNFRLAWEGRSLPRPERTPLTRCGGTTEPTGLARTHAPDQARCTNCAKTTSDFAQQADRDIASLRRRRPPHRIPRRSGRPDPTSPMEASPAAAERDRSPPPPPPPRPFLVGRRRSGDVVAARRRLQLLERSALVLLAPSWWWWFELVRPVDWVGLGRLPFKLSGIVIATTLEEFVWVCYWSQVEGS